MENGAEALKLAFAIFVFVIAMSTLFMVISQAKSTADTVLYYTDKTNFQNVYGVENQIIVGTDNLIATLFRYYKESISVKILDTNGDIVTIFDTAIEKNCPWRASNEKTIQRIKEFITKSAGESTTYKIGAFDYSNAGNYTENAGNLNVQLKPDASGEYVSATMSLKELCSRRGYNLQNAKFVQTFVEATVDGIYHTPSNYETHGGEDLEDDGTTIQITPGTKKVYITYQLH